jgi:hypothetical protein
MNQETTQNLGIISIAHLMGSVQEIAGRGIIIDHGMQKGIEIRVPFWRVRDTRDFLEPRRCIGMAFDVRRMTVMEHFLHWCIDATMPGPEHA